MVDETRLDEMGVDEMRVDEMGLDELGPTQTNGTDDFTWCILRQNVWTTPV